MERQMQRLFSKKELKKRLFAKYEVDVETDCWIWLGCWHKSGYGVMYATPSTTADRGKSALVHKIAAYIWLDIPLDSPQRVVRTCKSRACFNPEHLKVLASVGAAFKYYAKYHPSRRGENNNFSTTTLEQALDIRDALKLGKETPMQIADRIGCSRQVVYHIKSKRTWAYIWDKKFDTKLYTGQYGKIYGKIYAVRQVQENGSIGNHVDVQRRYAVSGLQR